MKKLKENKGITLIALIITIIVMLILVGVTVAVALNGGLFGKTQNAAKGYTVKKEKELIQVAYADYVAQKYTGGPKTEDFDELEIDLLGDDRKGKDISDREVDVETELGEDFDEEGKYVIVLKIVEEYIGILEEDLEFDEESGDVYIHFEYNGNRYVLTVIETEEYDTENNETIYKLMSKKLIVEPELTLGELATVTTNRINGHKEWEIVFVDSGNKYWLTDGDDEITEDIDIDLPDGWTKIDRPSEWKEETENKKVIAITDGINTIPLPLGYTLSDKTEEQTVAGGLVIKDSNGNEFVWIPASGFVYSYNSGHGSEPGASFKYANDGKYKQNDCIRHYSEMVESINKYEGFYIGRYETTIDNNNNIGSKINTTVLIGTREFEDERCYPWYAFYSSQRDSDVIGNNDYVQTNMIWEQQWDAMIEYLGNEQAESTISGTQTQVLKSGEATYNEGKKDIINNIYDLRRNGAEWTGVGCYENYGYGNFITRGGCYNDNENLKYINYVGPRFEGFGSGSDSGRDDVASRMTLYIK